MFLYKYLPVIYANCFNLCHCRHSTKCRAEGSNGRVDRSARSTRSATRSRRPPPTTTRMSSWWSRRPVGGRGPVDVARRRGGCSSSRPRKGGRRRRPVTAATTTTTTGASRHQARRLPQVRASPTSAGPRRSLSHGRSLPAVR